MSEIGIRPARPEDAEFIWHVNNDPDVRRQAVHGDSIEWSSHVDWLTKVFQDPDRLLYVVNESGDDCGTLRFDIDRERGWAYITIAIAPRYRGKGIGSEIIRYASEYMIDKDDIDRIVAEIRPENEHSLRAFKKAGFQVRSTKTRNGVLLNVLSFE